jgi:hypothetical protein
MRVTSPTFTPVPTGSCLAQIVGTFETPSTEDISVRCRLYPSVLTFAMFWPETSRP